MDGFFPPLPIYIGVTGHRDIPPECIHSLTAEVERLLLSVRSRYPHCPITVLSSLADGADRLCAKAALNAGCRLIVPLPMSAEEYKNDFSEASKREFEELCGRAESVFTVPANGPKQENAQRGYFYRQAGWYVAGHSHFLIALWDGEKTLYPEGGGTFETILFARERKLEVCVVQTPRRGGGPAGQSAGVPDIAELSVLNEFMGDIAGGGQKISKRADENRADFVDGQMARELSSGAKRVLQTCLYANALSLKYRGLKLLALRLLSFFGLFLVISFLLYDEMESDLMLFVYAALIFAAFFVYSVASKKRFHEKYIAYRSIAETLRVQFYWGMCGIVDRACESYSFTQKAALGFTGAVQLSLWEDLEEFAPVMPQKAKELWIQNQLAYHAASGRQKAGKDSFHKRATKVMLGISLAMFFIVAGMELFFKETLQDELPLNTMRGFLLMHEGQIVWRGVLKIALGTVSAGTAFLANYYGSLALPQQVSDNSRMKTLFESAITSDPSDTEKFTAAMREVGRESILECGGWYVAQRENAPGLFIG